MTKRCQVTGKGVLSGNNVSHANNKTRRRFYPNLQEVSFMSDTLGRRVRLRLCTNAMRTIEHHGGLDTYLLQAKTSNMHPKLLNLKRIISKKQMAKVAE